MYRTYNARPIPGKRPARSRHKKMWLLVFVVIIAAGYLAFALARPIPTPRTVLIPPVIPAQAKVGIPWPSSGQAAFGADGYGLLDTKGEQKPAPTASVAKIITALVVLQKKPLKLGEQGPRIPITAADVTIYNEYVAKNGAVIPVTEGQSISEYQALQAMLLPSANNISDTIAIWAFGSMEAYNLQANTYVKSLGMTQTTVSDASGFSPETVSTPADLIRLGDAALDSLVIAEIINQKQAIFPGVGTIQNVNSLLGTSGIRGIKTGNTDEAGGCFLAAADISVAGKTITVITAIMGSTSRPQAMRDSLPLIQSAVSQFRNVEVVKAGQVVGRITTAWGSNTAITADNAVSVVAWNGTALAPAATPKTILAPSAAHADAGSFSLNFTDKKLATKLHTKQAISGPSLWWRVTHPL